jgi:hypothetical protein
VIPPCILACVFIGLKSSQAYLWLEGSIFWSSLVFGGMGRDSLRFALSEEVAFRMTTLPTIILNNLITSCRFPRIVIEMASIICTWLHSLELGSCQAVTSV